MKNDRIVIHLFLFLISLTIVFACKETNKKEDPSDPVDPSEVVSDVEGYLTGGNKRFEKLSIKYLETPNDWYKVTLDKSVKYQEMEGFGVAMTGSSCYNLLRMSAVDRDSLLREVFDPKNGMGYSYIRISIGASDFSLDEYTCCDTKGIENFALHDYDKRDLIPILKEIVKINPDIRIMGSPWSCPKWMKVKTLTSNTSYDSWTSGQLNPDYYEDYAEYFVRFIKAMDAEGIKIASITPQNEPLNRGNSMSLYMGWEEERDFIRYALGPAFEKNGIQTKIVVYDHNFDYGGGAQDNYPLKIYAFEDAAKYIDGSAFHAYLGNASELDDVHSGAPEKSIYFTEQSIGSWNYSFEGDLMWNMKEVCLGTINRWCKAIIMWNFLLDDRHGPNRPGGCNTCYGAIDISSSNYKTMTRNSHYYTMAHLSKVVKPGAFRIKSSGYTTDGLYYSAFLNPDGSYGVVAQNDSSMIINICLYDGTRSFMQEIPAKSVVSFRWK